MRRPTESVSGLPEYGVSKLANVLFSAELSRRLAEAGVTSYAVNPGRVGVEHLAARAVADPAAVQADMKSTADGARSTLRAATAPDVESGRYYGARGDEEVASAPGRDAALAGELWHRSLMWTAWYTHRKKVISCGPAFTNAKARRPQRLRFQDHAMDGLASVTR